MSQNFYVGTGMPDYDHRTEDQEDLDARNRRSTLLRVLHSSRQQEHPGADLVLLVDALGLDEELDELTRRSAQRQRDLRDIRRQLQLLDGQEPDVDDETVEEDQADELGELADDAPIVIDLGD